MARRRYESEEELDSEDGEYYDSEDGEYYDDEELVLPTEAELRNRAILVLTSSYGLSALIHVGILLIALFIMWTEPEKQETKEVLLPKLERKEQEYDPEKKRSLHRRPEIQDDRIVDKVIKELEEEVEKANEIPKGTSMDNLANKNLDSTSVVDAFGVGGGAAGAYGQRWGKGSLTRNGGSAGTESAVLAALYWLKRHQDPDGKWSCSGFHKNCDPQKDRCWGHDMRTADAKGPGAGDARYDAGVTALALLAFLGNGHSHKYAPIPEFRPVVKKGLTYLKGIQKPDGSIGYEEGEDVYNHTIATMALCEAYTVSRDFTLKRWAQKAVDWLVRAQNPGLGWKYGVQPGKNDTSVTGWAVLGLKAAKVAKLNVPKAAFDGALAWFERATSEGGGPRRPPGLVGYERPADGGSTLNRKQLDHPDSYIDFEGAPTMTAVAVLCRIFTGQKRENERVRQGLKIMMARLPRWDGMGAKKKNQTNFYYWYYGTYGVFQATRLGSPEWQRWNKAMQESILGDGTNRQRMGGKDCADGSWDPLDEWGIPGGRVYATAINALTLEIYYRYERAADAAR
ncbi:hypothetical protein ACFL59_11185 [Planctomycetota bacterium]